MRCYLSRCTKCGHEQQFTLAEPYPAYGDVFPGMCKQCERETYFTRVLTRRTQAELNRQAAEAELVERIQRQCERYNLSYRLLHQSVVITTSRSDWSFDYHETAKTLYHESTYKYNLATGDPSKTHIQFEKRRWTIERVIDYIASHDGQVNAIT